MMRFENVCLESLGYLLPGEIVSSEQIEHWLAPLYERIGLSVGRLELMTGIAQRRLWQAAALPSGLSAQSVGLALEAAGIAPDRVGALIHASVCRDHLEPATSCLVHRLAGLPDECFLWDVSNACLGFLNGMAQLASMIELGQIDVGVVVSSESSRGLMETTIRALNADTTLTRRTVKDSVASLTIGSASVAGVLVHRRLSATGNRLLGGTWLSDTQGNHLCRSGQDTAGDSMQPLMQTDSEGLMRAGIALGQRAYSQFLGTLDWQDRGPTKTIGHQVGLTHRKGLLEALGLEPEHDFTTVGWLGNTGSAALPITLALAAERDFLSPGDSVGLLGIGSGINTVMLGVEWQRSLVLGEEEPAHSGTTEARLTDAAALAQPSGLTSE